MLGMEKGTFPYYLNEENPEKLNEDRRVFLFVFQEQNGFVIYFGQKVYSKD